MDDFDIPFDGIDLDSKTASELVAVARDCDELDEKNEANGRIWFSGDDKWIAALHRESAVNTLKERTRDSNKMVGIPKGGDDNDEDERFNPDKEMDRQRRRAVNRGRA